MPSYVLGNFFIYSVSERGVANIGNYRQVLVLQ